METTINQVNPVEYELEIEATHEDLADELKKRLSAQRKQAQMKGFRDGKVPMSIVKKRFGEAIGYQVAEEFIQQVYQDEVVEGDEGLDVLGQPKLTRLDYEFEGDLTAVVRFGVRPAVELKELSEEEVDTLAFEVTDEDVEKEVDALREREADLVPLGEDAEIPEDAYVQVDMQKLDEESGTPIIGEKEEGVDFFLDDERLHDALRDGIAGQTVGTSVRIQIPHQHRHADGEMHEHVESYEVTIKEAKERELRELDDEFVQEVTDEQFDTVDALREGIREELERAWSQQAQQFTRGKIMEKMLELHEVEVPESVTEMFLSSFVEDVKERNEGELPENFNEAQFRAANREEAERQGRWMLIRDQLIEEKEIEITEEDREAFFAEQAQQSGGQLDAEQMAQFYEAMPQFRDQVQQRVMSDKVFETLKEMFTLVEKDRETLEEEERLRREAAVAAEETGEES